MKLDHDGPLDSYELTAASKLAAVIIVSGRPYRNSAAACAVLFTDEQMAGGEVMKRIAAMVVVFMAGGLLAGCQGGTGTVNAGPVSKALSPLAGKWTGKSDMKGNDLDKFANSVAGGPLTGPSSMQLNADGTGFLKVADQPERPISWKQEGDRVILEPRGVEGTSDAKTTNLGGPWVGRLSTDRDTIVIDMEKVKVTLNRSS